MTHTDPEALDPLAAWIRAQREAQALSVEALAELVDAFPGEVVAWEHGRLAPTPTQLALLEEALGHGDGAADAERTLAEWLHAGRSAHGLSIEALAEQVDAFAGEVVAWEHGRLAPTPTQLALLEEVLGRGPAPASGAGRAPVSDTGRAPASAAGRRRTPNSRAAAEADARWPSPPEDLRQRYVEEQRSMRWLADHYGVARSRIRAWVDELELETRSRADQIRLAHRAPEAAAPPPRAQPRVAPAAPRPPSAREETLDETPEEAPEDTFTAGPTTDDTERLIELYLAEGLTISALAERMESEPAVVRSWLLRAGVEPRSGREQRRIDARRGHAPPLPDAAKLAELVEDERALERLAVYHGVDPRWLEHLLERRRPEPAEAEPDAAHPRRKPSPPREELEELYLEQQLGLVTVAKHYGVSPSVVRRWFAELEIPQRSSAEQRRLEAARPAPVEAPRPAKPAPSRAVQPAPPPAARPEPPRAAQPQAPRAAQPEPPRAAQPEPPRAAQPEPPRAAALAPPRAAQPEPPRTEQPAPPRAARPEPPRAAQPQAPRAEQPAPPRAARPEPPRAAPLAPPQPAKPAAPASSPRNGASAPATLASATAPAPDTRPAPSPARAAASDSSAPADASARQLVELHTREGYSVPELAARLARTPEAIHAALREQGVTVRSWRAPFTLPAGESVPPKADLFTELKEVEHDLGALAERHQVSLARLRAWLDHRLVLYRTGTSIVRYIKGDAGAREAVLSIDDEGAMVLVDDDVALEVSTHRWSLDADGRPVTRVAELPIPLTHLVLGLEPGAPDAARSVEHRSGNVLDCRRSNLA